LGNNMNDNLMRIYGAAFPTKDLLEKYIFRLEEAKKRDHRKLGEEQKLFFHSTYSPGSTFFLANGTRL